MIENQTPTVQSSWAIKFAILDRSSLALNNLTIPPLPGALQITRQSMTSTSKPLQSNSSLTLFSMPLERLSQFEVAPNYPQLMIMIDAPSWPPNHNGKAFVWTLDFQIASVRKSSSSSWVNLYTTFCSNFW